MAVLEHIKTVQFRFQTSLSANIYYWLNAIYYYNGLNYTSDISISSDQ